MSRRSPECRVMVPGLPQPARNYPMGLFRKIASESRVAGASYLSPGPRQIRTWRFPPSGSSVGTTRGSSPDVHIHPRTRKWEVSKEIPKAFPVQARSLAASFPPFVPRPCGMVNHLAQTPCVPIHAEVLEVASNAPHEGGVLHRNRLVPMATAPVGDVSHDPSAARRPRLARRDPVLVLNLPSRPPSPPCLGALV